MAEKIYTQQFGEVQKKSVCTTTDDLKFDNFTECGTYHIYEDKGDGCSCTYYLFVDKSANGQTTQTRVHCGKVEYRKQNADGTWTAWSASTGGDVPENVCAWGGSVSSVDEFPENPTAGTICTISCDFSNEGAFYTGVANDLFEITDGEGFLMPSEVDGTLYALYFKGDTADNTIYYKVFDVGEPQPVVRVYDINGLLVSDVNAAMPLGFPCMLSLAELGVYEPADIASFYLGFNIEEDQPAGESIKVYRKGDIVIWNGSEWCRYSPSYVTADLLKKDRDIGRACREIIKIQNTLIGGASE